MRATPPPILHQVRHRNLARQFKSSSTHGPSASPQQHEPSTLPATPPDVHPPRRDSKYDASGEGTTPWRRRRTFTKGRGLHPESPTRRRAWCLAMMPPTGDQRPRAPPSGLPTTRQRRLLPDSAPCPLHTREQALGRSPSPPQHLHRRDPAQPPAPPRCHQYAAAPLMSAARSCGDTAGGCGGVWDGG
jgi:hypothetical protein